MEQRKHLYPGIIENQNQLQGIKKRNQMQLILSDNVGKKTNREGQDYFTRHLNKDLTQVDYPVTSAHLLGNNLSIFVKEKGHQNQQLQNNPVQHHIDSNDGDYDQLKPGDREEQEEREKWERQQKEAEKYENRAQKELIEWYDPRLNRKQRAQLIE